MYTIENGQLRVSINTKGAELHSIFSKETNLEYLWRGDPAFWGKKSPLLFPIVGTLKNNIYLYKNHNYHMNRHGFARDMEFVVSNEAAASITFRLTENKDTLAMYPFAFRLDVMYTLDKDSLSVTYRVSHQNDDDIYFSIGAHPAFAVPLEKHLAYSDYYFDFGNKENAERWMISPEGLIETEPIPFFQQNDQLPITRELFKKDALVFKSLVSHTVTLKTDQSPHGIELHYPGFPYLGLWAAPKADFVCIEPWCGIADGINSNQRLEDKEGIQRLAPGKVFERTWQARFY